jgi:general secretion pathway protein M
MRHFWDQLTKSQKYTVAAGIVLIGAVLSYQFAIAPYLEARQKVRGAIVAGERALRELSVLGAEYGVLRARSEKIKRLTEGRPPGFSLFSYLEKQADEAAVKSNIRSINPFKSAAIGLYEETSAEMRLDKVTMKQLVDFLYLLESPEEMVRVRKASVYKMKESPEYLSVVLQVFTYQASPTGSPR